MRSRVLARACAALVKTINLRYAVTLSGDYKGRAINIAPAVNRKLPLHDRDMTIEGALDLIHDKSAGCG